MDHFQKSQLKTSKLQRRNLLEDDYEKDVRRSANKSQIVNEMTLLDTANLQNTLRFLGRSYSLGIIAIITSAVMYPLSVKIVKKIFRLKSFLNIHFAIIPIIVNINALILGNLQGFINAYQFKNNYPTDIMNQIQ